MRLFTLIFALATVLITSFAVMGQIPQKIKILIITGGPDFEREPFFDMFAAMEGIELRCIR